MHLTPRAGGIFFSDNVSWVLTTCDPPPRRRELCLRRRQTRAVLLISHCPRALSTAAGHPPELRARYSNHGLEKLATSPRLFSNLFSGPDSFAIFALHAPYSRHHDRQKKQSPNHANACALRLVRRNRTRMHDQSHHRSMSSERKAGTMHETSRSSNSTM